MNVAISTCDFSQFYLVLGDFILLFLYKTRTITPISSKTSHSLAVLFMLFLHNNNADNNNNFLTGLIPFCCDRLHLLKSMLTYVTNEESRKYVNSLDIRRSTVKYCTRIHL